MAHKETVNLYNQKNFIWLHVHIYELCTSDNETTTADDD